MGTIGLRPVRSAAVLDFTVGANAAKLLQGDGTFVVAPSTSPGGSSGALQYNNGGAFGGITAANSQVLVTDGSGVASWSATLPAVNGMALTNFANGRVASDVTTTDGTNLVDVTGLSFAVAASEKWTFEVWIKQGNSSTGGNKFAVNFPAAATVLASFKGNGGGLNSSLFTEWVTAADTVISNTWHTIASANGFAMIEGYISNGANAGTVQIRARPNTNGQTLTVYAGSYLVARRIA